jgi:hypothetical protein
LDIGCNDGSLLKIFSKLVSSTLIGVDPTNAIKEAEHLDFAFQTYFNMELSSEIKNLIGYPDIICFTNVFAHIENLDDLIIALELLIGPKTLLVIENHYLGSILSRFQVDTFYHEHPRTYSLKSFQKIAERLGVFIIKSQFPSRYGGNIRVLLSREKYHIEDENMEKAISNERTFAASFMQLQNKYDGWLDDSVSKIEMLKARGTLRGKGLPGRAVMLISALGLDSPAMPYVFEKPGSPKIGSYVPGTSIEILSDLALIDTHRDPIILWPWHIQDEVLSYLKELGVKGEVWCPLPTFTRIATL